MDIDEIKALAVERIYLIPGECDGQPALVWCDSPAPSTECDANESVGYVRADVYDEIIAKQAKAAIVGMEAAKASAYKMEQEAKRMYAECNPAALESERQANALLTKRIAELEREIDVVDDSSNRLMQQNEAQIKMNAQLMHERDALAAHVDRLREAANYALAQWVVAEDGECEGYNELAEALAEAPTTSLAKRDVKKQAEAMRIVAKWLSGDIEEGCTGLDLGQEIAGPTGCTSADKCRTAGERIFLEAARVWEYKSKNQC